MPVGRKYDFSLNGKGFMLARGETRGRAWSRTGRPDTVGQRGPGEERYGALPDELEFAEVWDDWSGGAFHAYRVPGSSTYHWGENMDARFPRQLVHCQQPNLLPGRYASTNVNVEAFLDVPLPGVANPPAGAGAVLVLGKGFVTSYAPTGLSALGSMFDRLYEASGGGATLYRGRPATFGSFVYIGCEGSPFARRGLDGAGYTLGPLPGEGFVVAGGRLWRRHSGYLLQSVAAGADPLATGNWSATLSIGNGQMRINDLTTLGDQLHAGLPDGLYAGDLAGTFVNVLPGPAGQANPDNGRDLDVSEGTVLGVFADDLVYYRPSELVAEAGQIGPTSREPNRSPVRGRDRCVRSLGPWRYMGRWTGTQSFLLAGRPGARGMVWHTQQRLPHVARVSRIHFDGITAASSGAEIPTRCWVATDASGFTGTAPLYTWPIPRLNDNPLDAEGVFRPTYCGSARIDLGAIDRGAPGTLKELRALEIWADNLASGYRWADVYYTVDRGARRYLGRATRSPTDVVYFPSAAETFVTGQSVEVSLESFIASGSQDISPVYRAVILRGSLRPRAIEMVTAVTRIADGVRDRQGQPLRSGATMLAELRDMADPEGSGRQPQLLVDLAGATSWVNVLAPIEEQEVYQRGMEEPELAATVRMVMLDARVNLDLSLMAAEDWIPMEVV